MNKATLLKEVEESIVAIHHLLKAMSPTTATDQQISTTTEPLSTNKNKESEEPKIIVMDMCAGKGLFSFLLSYLKPPQIQEIIMVEKEKSQLAPHHSWRQSERRGRRSIYDFHLEEYQPI